MRWSGGGDVDDDILEPLQPGSDDTLPGFDRLTRVRRGSRELDEPSTLRIVRPRDPKVLRLWLVAGAFALMSLLQFAGAAYVRDVHDDLRDVESVWRSVMQVDADRARADDALADTLREYGNSPGLEEQRDLLYDAARSRLEKLASELGEVAPRSDTVTGLRNDMLAALQQRRADFRREHVPRDRADDLREIDERLERTLDRWRVTRDEPDQVRLTAARELIERLGRMADEPTGLTIGAISTDALIVIDVDANDVIRRHIDVSEDARVHTLGTDLVVVDGGTARAFSTEPLGSEPRWQVPAERVAPAPDNESLWVQVGTQLQRIGPSGEPIITITVPEGSRLVGAPTPTRALIVSPTEGLLSTTREGGLEAGSQFRGTRGREFRAGTNGVYAAALDDRGRLLVARIDGERGRRFMFSALRADLPHLVDVAVIP